ncbi:MAG: NADP-specific glutamate dehydrogenase, partial [Planctomycetes bacterium]|nr:NADP-specific glutamate dehydrogenase [Planctomycetota bacterium]
VLDGKTCIVSGAGNVAQFLVEKLITLGATVVSMSDSTGTLYDPDGIDADKLAFVVQLKKQAASSLVAYTEKFKGTRFEEGARPWAIKGDLAFPCATQNEISAGDAKTMLRNGINLVCEGANMPSMPLAIAAFREAGIAYGPAKAANAGGVATSALEMAQNGQRVSWSRDEVDRQLASIMRTIHEKSLRAAERVDRRGDLHHGANIAGFVKVADAMLAQGVV